MMDISIDLTDGQVVPCLLYTITRMDGTEERITNAEADVTIGTNTWTVMPGLKAGVLTQRNDGTPPVMGMSLTMGASGPFTFSDVDRGKYERALVVVELTDYRNPVTRDFIFEGRLLGDINYDPQGNAKFDMISEYSIPRDIFIPVFTLQCRHSFGDPTSCKVPTYPYVLGGDLGDVARNEVIALGDRRRYRFGNDATPEDYENVYLEATVAGTTSGSVPSYSSTVGATTVDGTVTWTTRNAYVRAARVSSLTNTRSLVLDRDPDPRATSDDTWFRPMTILFRSGEYNGRRFKGSNWDGSARSVDTYLPCPLAAVNDWVEIAPDCDKTYEMCHTKYANAANHGGHPFYVGAKAQAQQLGMT